MVKHCKWGTCNSDSRYLVDSDSIKFIPFPKPCKDHRLLKRDSSLQLKHNVNECAQCSKCLVWINACRVEGVNNVDNITRSWFICSRHFVDGKPTLEFPNPLIAGSHPSVSIPDICYTVLLL